MIATLYDKFKPWSAEGSVWIFSDPHFEDPDCPLMNPGWVTPQEQVDIINKKVMPSDTLILLGDIGNPEWVLKIKSKNKILIMGNHDAGKTNFEYYFNEIYEGPIFIAEKILLSHEPVISSNWYNFHGHCHSDISPIGNNYFNCAADVVNYTPINLGAMIKQGILSKIDSVHRETINKASLNKLGH